MILDRARDLAFLPRVETAQRLRSLRVHVVLTWHVIRSRRQNKRTDEKDLTIMLSFYEHCAKTNNRFFAGSRFLVANHNGFTPFHTIGLPCLFNQFFV
jgi:hypothetical protein